MLASISSWVTETFILFLPQLVFVTNKFSFFCTFIPLCLQVCTGVYHPERPLPCDQSSVTVETLVHGQRDPVPDAHLTEPSHIVEDVEAAVDLVLEQYDPLHL